MITPKLNINGSSARDLIDPRQRAWHLIDDLVDTLARVTPHGRDYPSNAVAYTADREEHFERIDALRKLQHTLLHEALAIKDQED
jgi:hypothetical protein